MALIEIKKINEEHKLRREIKELKQKIEELEEEIINWRDFGYTFFSSTGIKKIYDMLDWSKFYPDIKKPNPKIQN